MKKLLSCLLLAVLVLGLPSTSEAKGRRNKHFAVGEVTAVNDKSITIKEGKRETIRTIFVPAGTPINDKGGSPSSASASTSSTNGNTAPTLSGLVGKHVRIKESSAGTAGEIMVIEHGRKKKA